MQLKNEMNLSHMEIWVLENSQCGERRLKCRTQDEEFERICVKFNATARFLSQTRILKIPAETFEKVQYFGS